MRAHAKRKYKDFWGVKYHIIELWTTPPAPNGEFYHAYLFTGTRATFEEAQEQVALFVKRIQKYTWNQAYT